MQIEATMQIEAILSTGIALIRYLWWSSKALSFCNRCKQFWGSNHGINLSSAG